MASKSRSRKSKKSKSKSQESQDNNNTASPSPALVDAIEQEPEAREEDPISDLPLGQKRRGLQLSRLVGEVLMPGDEFVLTSQEGVVVLGPGLQLKSSFTEDPEPKVAIVVKAGILVKQNPNTFYIDMASRAYLPYKQDDIVGVITKRSGDQYVLDIGTRDRVTLSKMAFEGATKKNRPDLKVGDVVFGRLLELPSDFPFELSCVTSTGKAMGFGPLENGLLFQIPTPAVRALLSRKKQGGSEILKKLEQIVPFEVVVGFNGFVWVKSKDEVISILLSQVIRATADLRSGEHITLLDSFRNSFESIQGLLKSK